MNALHSFWQVFFSFLFVALLTAQEAEDRHLWLEEIDSERALAWVNAQNQRSVTALQQHGEFQGLYNRILAVLDSEEKIASPTIIGDYIYNFWQDEAHARGIWRRIPFAGYFDESIDWETVLDLDELAQKEGLNWAYKGAAFLHPTFDLCMVNLSRGGGDAIECREFDLVKKEFVRDGFFLPQAKSDVAWIDRSTVLVATDFGAGTTTTSGYPRMAKIWRRGTSLAAAETLLQGQETDVRVEGFVIETPERAYVMAFRAITFYTSQKFTLADGELVELPMPLDAQLVTIFKNQLLIELKSDWEVEGALYPAGSLLSIDYDRFLQGDRRFQTIYAPDARASLAQVATTQNYLLLNKLVNVKSELHRYALQDGAWISAPVHLPDHGAISVVATERFSDRYFFQCADFIHPTTLYAVAGENQEMRVVKRLPHFFKSDHLQVEQYEVASKDGVLIPYFIVFDRETKLDGANPTLLYGYGGFEIPMQPSYDAVLGAAWLEKGGVYIRANIRGGGEFGPKWHRAALKENRQRAYDDFIAIAEDLIRRNITSPDHLGIMGGSNGGLLVGVAFTQRPDLFNAVVCSAPLLDMQRYSQLPPGASWMAEYGNPDIPEEWAYIKKYSPYQNLGKEKKYPQVLFTTTTRDDRVHPGHARKMAAKMEELGHPCYYFENTEGGHGAGVTNEQRAFMLAIEFAYLHERLK
ncbi:S9 family peptidase [candidate division KSB1 bacterium]|nr:S9 family peptidase [candidate division KSB1 bacterium]RQW06052.1 MAG: S9 family peptidase [candidate division KSB1 bacterium]